MNTPHSVLIGTKNTSLELFDDEPVLKKAGGLKKINAIRVFHTENYVRGFEIFYKLNDGDLLKASHNVPSKKNLKTTIFEIGPDDYISEISGLYEIVKKKNKIVNITIVTYRGKANTFGGMGGQSFKQYFSGFTFGAWKGGFKKQVEWLEIDVLPLPVEFKSEMIKLNIIVEQKPQVQNANHPAPQPPQGGQFVPKVAQVYQPNLLIQAPQIQPPPIQAPKAANLQQWAPQQPQQPQTNYVPFVPSNGPVNINGPSMTASKYPTFNNQPQAPQLPNQPYQQYGMQPYAQQKFNQPK